MRSWMKNAGRVALIAAALLAAGSGIASADSTERSNGTLSGNRLSAPVNTCGNAMSLHGEAKTACGSATPDMRGLGSTAPPTSVQAPGSAVTRPAPAAAGSTAPNAGRVGTQDLLVLERLTVDRQNVDTVAGP